MTFASEAELEDALSAPSAGLLESLRSTPGDIIMLGAGGKMGPTLARMAKRAPSARPPRSRDRGVALVVGEAEHALHDAGVETIRCDLLDRSAVAALPDAPNVIFMAGQKFGTRGAPAMTWAMNTLVPAIAPSDIATRASSRSRPATCIRSRPVARGGSRETDAPAPVGEYAASCLGRERVFELYVGAPRHARRDRAAQLRDRSALRRARRHRVARAARRAGAICDMGYVNVIWQGDANASRSSVLPHAAAPPFVVNVTGRETLAVRELAERFGALLDRAPTFTGTERRTRCSATRSHAHALFAPPAVTARARCSSGSPSGSQAAARCSASRRKFEARDGKF